MKNYLISSLFILLCLNVNAQIDIDGPTDLICPGEPVVYSVQPASVDGCTYQWDITNGIFSNGQTSIQGTWLDVINVTVIWDNVFFQGGQSIPEGIISVQVFGCPLPTGERTYTAEDVVIKTLNGVTPGNISGNPSIPIGNTSNRTFSIPRIQFPGTGQNGGSITVAYADSYQWLIPAGWKIGTLISDEV